jgi:hypothetical protein
MLCVLLVRSHEDISVILYMYVNDVEQALLLLVNWCPDATV